MDREEEIGLYNNARLTFGLTNQLRMITEECAELIQAINKYERKMNDELATSKEREEAFNHIIEERTDVQIVLNQFDHNFNTYKKVEDVYQYKLERLQRDINKRSAFKKIVKELDDARVQMFLKLED